MAARAVNTVDVDADLLVDTRSAMKPSAEVADAEVVERALRSYLSRRALDTSQAMSGLPKGRRCGSPTRSYTLCAASVAAAAVISAG